MSSKSENTWKLNIKDTFFANYAVEFDEKRIDVLVYAPGRLFSESFLWAECKRDITNTNAMFTQLLLTIKKTVSEGDILPPKYLGVFDKEKIVFVEYYHIAPVFALNDFNWNETPSNFTKKTENTVAKFLTDKMLYQFRFVQDAVLLHEFIAQNFQVGNPNTAKAQINKNNFVIVYNKWLEFVKDSIVVDFSELKEYDILDGDFFLADLLSENNVSIYNELKVILRETHYFINVDKIKRLLREIGFHDGGKLHKQFWDLYQRPPKNEYHFYIKNRRDLLVPQNVRERKGSFFTPQIWVEKSQEYLARVFGENWQDEYYIWDCCCGTGNLLAGLVNADNIWASTLDSPDVEIINDMVDHGFNLLKPHVFKFDFLSDEFKPVSQGGKLPDSLYRIICDPEKQKKLIIYMNPPYAEAPNTRTLAGTGQNKPGVAKNLIYEKYFERMGKASREIFAQFFTRICFELPQCKLASFSKLKFVSGFAFKDFREYFRCEFKAGFIVLANTFDNVSGNFPIGFTIWDLEKRKSFKKITCRVMEYVDEDHAYESGKKTFYTHNKTQYINEWRKTFFGKGTDRIGYLRLSGVDMQTNNGNFITSNPSANDVKVHLTADITKENLIDMCVYLAVRHCVVHHWTNDRDQFLYPDDKYRINKRFLNNCLIYSLFHSQNRIKSSDGINHWLPFKRAEIKAADSFASTFMSDFLQTRGKFSKAAVKVLEAGKALWTYYHETIKNDDKAFNDASLYEIREYFKGRKNGRLNTKSSDVKFNELDKTLREATQELAKEIQPYTYEYGFLLDQ